MCSLPSRLNCARPPAPGAAQHGPISSEHDGTPPDTSLPSKYRPPASQGQRLGGDRRLPACPAGELARPGTGQRELNADLVLEGGGVKGIGLAGAICVLAEAGYQFPRAAGTSAGAIAAVLIAAVEKSGQDMSVLHQYLSDIDYTQFMQAGTVRRVFERLGGKFADACELLFRSGLYSGDYLATWLGAKLAECGVASWADLAISTADDPEASLPDGR